MKLTHVNCTSAVTENKTFGTSMNNKYRKTQIDELKLKKNCQSLTVS